MHHQEEALDLLGHTYARERAVPAVQRLAVETELVLSRNDEALRAVVTPTRVLPALS
jgi:hypothetical protein